MSQTGGSAAILVSSNSTLVGGPRTTCVRAADLNLVSMVLGGILRGGTVL